MRAGVHELPSWTCKKQEHFNAPPTWDFGIWHLVEYGEDGFGEIIDARESLTDDAKEEMELEAKFW